MLCTFSFSSVRAFDRAERIEGSDGDRFALTLSWQISRIMMLIVEVIWGGSASGVRLELRFAIESWSE